MRKVSGAIVPCAIVPEFVLPLEHLRSLIEHMLVNFWVGRIDGTPNFILFSETIGKQICAFGNVLLFQFCEAVDPVGDVHFIDMR